MVDDVIGLDTKFLFVYEGGDEEIPDKEACAYHFPCFVAFIVSVHLVVFIRARNSEDT